MEKLYEITDKGKKVLENSKKENHYLDFVNDLNDLFTHFVSEPKSDE